MVAVVNVAAEDNAEIEVGGLVYASCRPLGRRSGPKHVISMLQNSAADRL